MGCDLRQGLRKALLVQLGEDSELTLILKWEQALPSCEYEVLDLEEKGELEHSYFLKIFLRGNRCCV